MNGWVGRAVTIYNNRADDNMIITFLMESCLYDKVFIHF